MNTHKMIAGYESQQAFTSIFKSMYKQTPFEYRQNQAHGGMSHDQFLIIVVLPNSALPRFSYTLSRP